MYVCACARAVHVYGVLSSMQNFGECFLEASTPPRTPRQPEPLVLERKFKIQVTHEGVPRGRAKYSEYALSAGEAIRYCACTAVGSWAGALARGCCCGGGGRGAVGLYCLSRRAESCSVSFVVSLLLLLPRPLSRSPHSCSCFATTRFESST